MKVIFDFDDVLLDSKTLKEYIYEELRLCGVDDVALHYKAYRDTKVPVSLKGFLRQVLVRTPTPEETIDSIYEYALTKTKGLVNQEMFSLVKKVGKKNCFIVTNGEDSWQRDKIGRSGVGDFVSSVTTVPDSKKEEIEKICTEFKDEVILFVDDKEKFFEDLDMSKYTNLRVFLYNETNSRNNVKALTERILELENENN